MKPGSLGLFRKALSKLVNNIDKRTPPEEKVLGIIDVLKRHPEKEGEIIKT